MKVTITDQLLNKLIQNHHNSLHGGFADKVDPNQFDRQQLLKGVKVETEHTDDLQMALEIAMDHLKEFPDYYDRLQKAGL